MFLRDAVSRTYTDHSVRKQKPVMCFIVGRNVDKTFIKKKKFVVNRLETFSIDSGISVCGYFLIMVLSRNASFLRYSNNNNQTFSGKWYV